MRRCRVGFDLAHGKPAHTLYEVLRIVPLGDGSRAAMLRLTPTTGRTHQLRVHSFMLVCCKGTYFLWKKAHKRSGNIRLGPKMERYVR